MARGRTNSQTHAFDIATDTLVEPRAARRRRLTEQAKDGKKALVVDRSGSLSHLEHSAKRLKSANVEQRVLYVPHWDMAKAGEAMRRAGVTGVVSNLCGGRHRRIRSKS
jgi:hypothetical protein